MKEFKYEELELILQGMDLLIFETEDAIKAYEKQTGLQNYRKVKLERVKEIKRRIQDLNK